MLLLLTGCDIEGIIISIGKSISEPSATFNSINQTPASQETIIDGDIIQTEIDYSTSGYSIFKTFTVHMNLVLTEAMSFKRLVSQELTTSRDTITLSADFILPEGVDDIPEPYTIYYTITTALNDGGSTLLTTSEYFYLYIENTESPLNQFD